MIAARPQDDTMRFTCPECGAALRRMADDVLICAGDRTSYRKSEGVWHLVASSRQTHFDRFIAEYDQIRRLEGRGSRDPGYYRRLPYDGDVGRQGSDWRIRASSFDCFVREVLDPIERASAPNGGKPLRILDVGAGNGWLSNRLSKRGHELYAVDLRTGVEDGLGAHVHYESAFTCVCSEFDRLPFEDDAFDLAVFNAAFHYSEDYERTLREALRVVRPDGRIVIIDSPIYRDAGSGKRMVRDRTRRFRATYGLTSDSLDCEEYLTERRLRQLSARTGLTWTMHKPNFGLAWSLLRVASRVRNRREPAQFAVIAGRRHVDADDSVRHMQPRRIRQHIGRAGLRLRFAATQRKRLLRVTDEEFNGIRMRIPPGVFDPLVFRTGAFLAEVVLDDVLPKDARVLDLGCGSGINALAAACRGGTVTAVDVNPKAVDCTRHNAERNGLDLRVFESDLFERVDAFDVVLFNPPYFGGGPKSPFELAWRSEDVVERFSAQLTQHLSPGGFALVVLSSDGRCPAYLRRFQADGHRIARVAERRFMNETLTVFALR